MHLPYQIRYSDLEKTADRITASKTMADLNGWNAPSQLNTTITDQRPPSKITTPDGLIIEL